MCQRSELVLFALIRHRILQCINARQQVYYHWSVRVDLFQRIVLVTLTYISSKK